MKIKLLILSVLLLTGCSNYVNMETFKASVQLCKVNGGLKSVHGKSLGNAPVAYCNNGASFRDPVKLSEKVKQNEIK